MDNYVSNITTPRPKSAATGRTTTSPTAVRYRQLTVIERAYIAARSLWRPHRLQVRIQQHARLIQLAQIREVAELPAVVTDGDPIQRAIRKHRQRRALKSRDSCQRQHARTDISVGPAQEASR